MGLIPDEELTHRSYINLAPMVDFLFVILAVFAVTAITRSVLSDSELKLVHANDKKTSSPQQIDIEIQTLSFSVTDKGFYKWKSADEEFILDTPQAVQQELHRMELQGLLPQDRASVKILLHIDKDAKWEPIMQIIFAIRQIGYDIHPVYAMP
jgi:biopolymer transport protein ExbD